MLQTFNRETLRLDGSNPDVEGVIESYELAFKMQKEMPQAMNISHESEATKKLYGIGDVGSAHGRGQGAGTDYFGRKCLLARRLVEAGVRFVEIAHRDWDPHFNLTTALGANCASVDQPIAGLLTDLEQRGLLNDTMVVWGGEFGRTPHAQGLMGATTTTKPSRCGWPEAA